MARHFFLRKVSVCDNIFALENLFFLQHLFDRNFLLHFAENTFLSNFWQKHVNFRQHFVGAWRFRGSLAPWLPGNIPPWTKVSQEYSKGFKGVTSLNDVTRVLHFSWNIVSNCCQSFSFKHRPPLCKTEARLSLLLTFKDLLSRVSEPCLLSHVTVLLVLPFVISILKNKHIHVSKAISIKLLIQSHKPFYLVLSLWDF